jgi:predicted dehydrogenase
MENGKIRLGIVGAGRMGVTHQSIINSHPDVEVVATADPSAVMNSLLEKYVKVRTYKDHTTLIAKERLDGLLVCTPPSINHEILVQACQKGLHAFVEKPFTLSAKQGAELARMYAERKLVNQVGYVNRFNDVFFKTKSLVDAGLLGKVVRFRSEMYSRTIIREQDDSSWRSSHANGGGAIYEMASHAIDLINFLFGRPDKVAGTSLSSVFSKNVEDVVSSSFIYRNGLSGSLYVNWSDESFRKPTNKLEVFGQRGKILADQHGLKIFLTQDNNEQGLKAGWNNLNITDVFSNVPFYVRGIEFTAQLYHFIDCIKSTGARTRCTFADATDTLSVIDDMFSDFASIESVLRP